MVHESVNDLCSDLRAGIAILSDPDRAARQQAYMKSAMPFRGVPVPMVRRLTRDVLARQPLVDHQQLVDCVTTLWNEAAFREERYAALTVLMLPKHRRWRDPTLLSLYDHLIITGRWWDLVDDVATHAVAELVRVHPTEVSPTIRTWAADPDLWRRRAALVCQVGLTTSTDPDLLADAILASIDDRDFFIRKGIGWALRAYAATNADWVRNFVSDHRDQLSPLSIREATKHLT